MRPKLENLLKYISDRLGWFGSTLTLVGLLAIIFEEERSRDHPLAIVACLACGFVAIGLGSWFAFVSNKIDKE